MTYYYSDSNKSNPSLKFGIGYSWALGTPIYGNHKFKTSLLAFMSISSLYDPEALGSVGLKLNSIIYIQKEKAKFNINSSDVSRDHIKLTLGYSYLVEENAQFIIGLGTGFSFIRHFKRPKFNFWDW